MGELTAPVELLLLINFFGTGMAYWAGRESGRAKEQRVRRVHVDDAFRRGKASGYAFLDSIDVARTEAMSEVRVYEDGVAAEPVVLSGGGGGNHVLDAVRVLDHAAGGNVYDYDATPDL